jgi:hypothetical protein
MALVKTLTSIIQQVKINIACVDLLGALVIKIKRKKGISKYESNNNFNKSSNLQTNLKEIILQSMNNNILINIHM